MSTTSAERLAARYGTRRRRVRPGVAAAVGGGVVAVLVTGVVAWLTLSDTAPRVDVTNASWEVLSDEAVRVSFSVSREDPSQALRCAVEATDASHAQVGVVVVDLPAAAQPENHASRVTPITLEVTTFARAEQAGVVDNGCLPLPQDLSPAS